MKSRSKVVLIAGASGGLGRALVDGFANESYTVVAIARTLGISAYSDTGSLEKIVQEAEMAGGHAVAMACDMTSELALQTMLNRVTTEIGPIAVLVNNSGFLPDIKREDSEYPDTQLDTDHWDESMGKSILSQYLLCKYVLSLMIRSESGSMVILTSPKPILSETEMLIYGPIKQALEMMTIRTAYEARPFNIAVNALGPGIACESYGDCCRGLDLTVCAALWLAKQDASTFSAEIVQQDQFGKSWGDNDRL